MKDLTKELTLFFLLVFLPEKGAAFSIPPSQNKLRYRTRKLFVAYLDDLAPQGGGDDIQDDDDIGLNDGRGEPSEPVNGDINGAYRVDIQGSASNGLPHGVQEQPPFHPSRSMDDVVHPSTDSYSDPWSGSAPVNGGTMKNNVSAYRERTGAVSSAHNRKGPPIGSFAPPSMRMNTNGYYHNNGSSAHNNRDVIPWNSQRPIEQSSTYNLRQRPPASGAASMANRYRSAPSEPEAPVVDEYEYMDTFEPPPVVEDNRNRQKPAGTSAENAVKVTASYFAPDPAVGPASTESDRPIEPVTNSGHDRSTDPNSNDRSMPDEAKVPAMFTNNLNGIPPANGAKKPDVASTSPNPLTAPGMPSFANNLNGVPQANGASTAKVREDASAVPGQVTAPGFPSANGVSSEGVSTSPAQGAAPGMSSFTNNLSSFPPANGATTTTPNAGGSSTPAGIGSFADTLKGPPAANGASDEKINDAATRVVPPGVGSFADTLNGSRSPNDAATVKKADSVSPAVAPGTGSFADKVNGASSPSAPSSIATDDVASKPPGQAAAPGAASITGSLPNSPLTAGPSSVTNDETAATSSFGTSAASAGSVASSTKKDDAMPGVPDSLKRSPSASATSSATNINSVAKMPSQEAAPVGMPSFVNGASKPKETIRSKPDAPRQEGFNKPSTDNVTKPRPTSSGPFSNSPQSIPVANGVPPVKNGVAVPKKWGGIAPPGIKEDVTTKKSGGVAPPGMKKEAAVPKTSGGVAPPGIPSFLDRKESATTSGTSPDTLRGTASTSDASRVKTDAFSAAPKKTAAPGASSLLDRVNLSKSKSTEAAKASTSGSGQSSKTTSATGVSEPNAKERGAVAKDPVETAATGVNSFLNRFTGGSKERSSTKQEKSTLKPKPPKTPPPDIEKAVKKPPKSQKRVIVPEAKERLRKQLLSKEEVSDAPEESVELTVEERIAASIAEAKDKSATKRTFESTEKSLRDFKSRTEKRLSRSTSKKEKAAEKVADIRARMEAEARAIEEKLAKELDETQAEIDEEVAQIVDLLANEVELEVEREENMVQLMDSLQEFVAAKEYDIANEKNITKEVMRVRSKLKDGAVADNLDNLVEQKLSVVLVEQQLVNDLLDFLVDLQELSENAHARASRITQTLEEFSQPKAESSTPYDWTDIEQMEEVLEEAAESVKKAEERIFEVSQGIDNALVSRAIVLGEDVPPGVAKSAQKAAARSVKRVTRNPEIDFDLDVEHFVELKNKDEKELLAMFAKSVGSVTVDTSKAAAFGIKAIVDTVTGKPGEDAANQIASEINKDKEELESLRAMEDSKKNKVAEKVKSAASVLGSVTKAGSTIVKGVGETDSAHVAGEALKDTTKDLFTSLETAAALGAKLFSSAVNRIEQKKDKNKKDDS